MALLIPKIEPVDVAVFSRLCYDSLEFDALPDDERRCAAPPPRRRSGLRPATPGFPAREISRMMNPSRTAIYVMHARLWPLK